MLRAMAASSSISKTRTCNLLFHAKRIVDELRKVRPARDGTLRVLKASREAGVKRVVMTSSMAAIAYGRGERAEPFTEADWTDEANRDDTSAYERSKTIAERAAWAWHKAEGGALELVTVNPALVLWPVLGTDFSASIEAIKMLLNGSIPALPRFGFSLVDVRASLSCTCWR